ncbi:uncharacterized protein C8Q71DRAFT_50019 [Rhodofomes roseus]|uniref:HMG box domain-containing protein n=1 Tax=Rhodofomes roseus TaxID=34475 RepID=A0ABQ8KFP8_9APHY|nr:uncharacterized protein C8Q71DRAFT_50019 [Rhodofomes roseus]KAH9836610.1 hypothetical protein C8Q71DRAFT_50019 [Rhodofomes roseus]
MPAVRGKTSTASLPARTRGKASIPRPWSPSDMPSPEDLDITATTSSPNATSAASRRRKGPDYIPRPPNAFILFRKALFQELKEGSIEHDQRLFSQIISTTWSELSATNKDVWYRRAADMKEEHARKYPNYRFSPVIRTDKPRKRNVKRNGPKDKERCRRLGKLIAEGRGIPELEREAKRIDASMREADQVSQGASELGIPVSKNYSTSIFDATLCESFDASVVSAPQPSTPRLPGPRIGIPTHAEWSPVKKSCFAPPTPTKRSIEALSSCLIFSPEDKSAKVEPPSTPSAPFKSYPSSPSPKDTEALFLPSTPSPPSFTSPLPIPAHKLEPMSWSFSSLLADAPGIDTDWSWYPSHPSPFDASSSTAPSTSSTPSAPSPSSSAPVTPPQYHPSPFLPQPAIASQPAHLSPFDQHSPLATAPVFEAPQLNHAQDIYVDALDPLMFSKPSNPWVYGMAKEFEGLGLYETLMDGGVMRGYMG